MAGLISFFKSAVEAFAPNVCTMGLLAAVDHALLNPFLSKRMKPSSVNSARWFFTHAFGNMLVCLTAAPALWTTLTDPYNSMDASVYADTSMFGAASSYPLMIINSIHFYHMVGGYRLSGADYFHHLLFAFPIGIPCQLLNWGAVVPMGGFFISGLPGGLSYLFLGLLKLGRISSITEKRVTANLNTWVRTPGILLSSIMVLQAVLYGKHQIPLPASFIILTNVILPIFNALYYQKQAIANYAVHYMTSLLGQDPVVSERMRVLTEEKADALIVTPIGQRLKMKWKEAIAVPQRGC